MNHKAVSLIYLSGYLLLLGLVFLLIPAQFLDVIHSKISFSDSFFPRFTGCVMIGLGGMVANQIVNKDYKYLTYSLIARSFFTVLTFIFWWNTRDTFYLLFLGILILGLLISLLGKKYSGSNK